MKRTSPSLAAVAAGVALATLAMLSPSLGVAGFTLDTTCMAMDPGGHDQARDAAPGGGSTKGATAQSVVCALDGMKMQRSPDTSSAEYEGKTYYFCSDDEKKTFLRNPERYAGR